MKYADMSSQVERWAAALGKPLTAFEQMKVARPFRYDRSQNRYYRVLKPVVAGVPYGYIEIDLTIHPTQNKCLFEVLVHSQAADRVNDKFLSNVPDDLKQRLQGLHTHEVAQWVLYGDVYSRLDLTRLAYLVRRNEGLRGTFLTEVLEPGIFSEEIAV